MCKNGYCNKVLSYKSWYNVHFLVTSAKQWKYQHFDDFWLRNLFECSNLIIITNKLYHFIRADTLFF